MPERIMIQNTNERFQNSDLRSAIDSVICDYQDALSNNATPSSLSTGFSGFDQKINGLYPGLHLLAGRSQMGKTTLMLNMADHICFEQKVPSLIFSMELRVAEIMRRMLFSKSSLDPFYRDRNPHPICKAHLRILRDAANQIAASRLFIEENITFGVDDLLDTAKQHKHENHIGFIAIDSLQLLRSPASGSQTSTKAEILAVVSKLKHFALESNLPILLIVNIPRKSSRRKDLVKGLPLAHHIKHRDTIDGYLDTITTLYQPKYYTEDEGQFLAMQSLAKLTICKSPRTSFHQIDLHFDKKIMRFFEVDESETENSFLGYS
jgi:replicative DNA helicase